MALEIDYVTLAELKEWLRIGDTADDAVLQGVITSASRAVDDFCNRSFGLLDAPVAYEAEPWGRTSSGLWEIVIPDLMTEVGLTVSVDGSPLTSDQWSLRPRDAALRNRPWTGMRVDAGYCPDIVVSAPWGWTTVPDPATYATRQQAQRWASRRDSPYGVTGSPESGGELRLLAKLDPDVAVALNGYVRPRRVR